MARILSSAVFALITALLVTSSESQSWPGVRDPICRHGQYCVFPLNTAVRVKTDYDWLNRTTGPYYCEEKLDWYTCCPGAQNATKQSLSDFFAGFNEFVNKCLSFNGCPNSKCTKCVFDEIGDSCCTTHNTLQRLRNNTTRLQSACQLFCQNNQNNCNYIGCNALLLYHDTCDEKESPTALGSEDQDHNIAVPVLGVLVAVLALVGATVLVLWLCRRRKATASGSSLSCAQSQESSSGPSPSESNTAILHNGEPFPRKQAENGATSPPDWNGGQRYTPIDIVANLCPRSQIQSGVYNELDDVTNRKLPPVPAGNDSYPCDFTAEEAMACNRDEGKQDDSNFILQEGTPSDETGSRMRKRAEADGSTHDVSEYSPLQSSNDRQKSSDQDEDYTPLGYTPTEGQASNGALPRKGQKKGGQYFILEEEAADDNKDEGKGGQYFTLEDETGEDSNEQGKDGRYFVLEENAI